MKTVVGILVLAVGFQLAWMLPGFDEAKISSGYQIAHNVIIGIAALIAAEIWD